MNKIISIKKVIRQYLGLVLMLCLASPLFCSCFPHADVTDVIELPKEGGKTTFPRELDFYELVDKEGMKGTRSIGIDSAYVEYKWLRIEWGLRDMHVTFIAQPNNTGKDRHLEIDGIYCNAVVDGVIVRQKGK